MARANLTVQDIVKTGVAPNFVAADTGDGNQFVNDGDCFIEVKNTGGSPINVTVTSVGKLDGMDMEDLVVAVPATTGDRMIGPFAPTAWNNAGGLVYVNVSAAATIAVLRLKS